jgi:hypothetical protein
MSIYDAAMRKKLATLFPPQRCPKSHLNSVGLTEAAACFRKINNDNQVAGSEYRAQDTEITPATWLSYSRTLSTNACCPQQHIGVERQTPTIRTLSP